MAPNQKVAYHKIVLEFDFSGGHFYEKIPKSKIFVALPAIPAFRPHYFRPGAEIQNSAPIKLFVLSSRFQKGMTLPPKPKIHVGDRFGRNDRFPAQGRYQPTGGAKLPAQKLLAKSNSLLGSKVMALFCRDTQTHRHTFPNRTCTTRGVKNFFCIYVWGKL